MYRSFDNLVVSGEAQLKDPARIKALERERNSGSRLGAALLALGGLCCLALCVFGLALLRAPASPTSPGWSLPVISGLFAVMLLGMAAAFFREASLCPLAGYLRSPEGCRFEKGRVEEAVCCGGSGSSRRMLLKGNCGGLPFIDEFEAGAWSNAVAERGEDSLKPGDDRYDQKGKRARLPLEVWVLRGPGVKAPAALVGIPAEALRRG